MTNILVEQFMRHADMSRADATLIVDLADHAAKSAIDTIIRIAETCPPHLAPQMFTTALQITEVLIANGMEDITNSLGHRVIEMPPPPMN